MQIYVPFDNLRQNCEFLDQARLRKMILEYAQILSSAASIVIPRLGLGREDLSYANSMLRELFKPTHLNHPCVLWAAENHLNYTWLLRYMRELNRIYSHYSNREHGCMRIVPGLDWFSDNLKRMNYGVQHASGIQFLNLACNTKLGIDYRMYEVHKAYRLYLTHRWILDDRAGRTPTWYHTGTCFTDVMAQDLSSSEVGIVRREVARHDNQNIRVAPKEFAGIMRKFNDLEKSGAPLPKRRTARKLEI